MDINAILEYYRDLLIIQYGSKEKARATIEAFVNIIVAEGLIDDVKNGFNIDTAVGEQLNILDKYIGVGRDYEGSLLGDDIYRFLMKLKIVQNSSDHSVKSIQDSLYRFFEDDLYMHSDGNMKMWYYCANPITTEVELAINKEVLPRPMGVGFGVLLIPDDAYFGFTTYDGVSVAEAGYTDYAGYGTDVGEFLDDSDILI